MFGGGNPENDQKRIRDWKRSAPVLRLNFRASSSSSSSSSADDTDSAEVLSRYSDRPWEYLESEEYIERYGSKPVWSNYRRNHKGGVPPQKTRKTCIRGDKICGNPCPICRDPNIIVHYKNVNLLQQFISPQTGIVHDPTRTGACMKQQKLLNKAIETARDCGLLSAQLVDQGFSKSLQHFSLVVVKVSINLADRVVLNHPQLALGLRDEPGIVAHNYHS
ncbi:28S ribosomal protein S18b, mitochondrial-like [Sinocyclocheilus grahami]|uniref:28S ribosomal protein S18b, mitochondrial-like n=1 Tax=Sinocyclocheilus grahami TaxID=75366 RepID=UPI0007AD35F4|nr:PREDICTED: 28S ribosomal protein S18b, mitochondrial-like [Sinocyclocheilus grahami]